MLDKWMIGLSVVLGKESPMFSFFLQTEHDLEFHELPWLFTWTYTTYKNQCQGEIVLILYIKFQLAKLIKEEWFPNNSRS